MRDTGTSSQSNSFLWIIHIVLQWLRCIFCSFSISVFQHMFLLLYSFGKPLCVQIFHFVYNHTVNTYYVALTYVFCISFPNCAMYIYIELTCICLQLYTNSVFIHFENQLTYAKAIWYCGVSNFTSLVSPVYIWCYFILYLPLNVLHLHSIIVYSISWSSVCYIPIFVITNLHIIIFVWYCGVSNIFYVFVTCDLLTYDSICVHFLQHCFYRFTHDYANHNTRLLCLLGWTGCGQFLGPTLCHYHTFGYIFISSHYFVSTFVCLHAYLD